MAAAAPSHRIHSIHGAFGAPSRYGHSSLSMSTAQASWNRIPNVCAPRRSSYDSDPLAPLARTTPASGSGACTDRPTGLGMRSLSTGVSASGSRPRRTTISYGSPTPTRRAPPPPPVPAERTASALASSVAASPAIPKTIAIPEVEDPFADAVEPVEELSPFPPTSSSARPSRVASAVSSYAMCGSSSTSLGGCGAQSNITVPPGLGVSIPSAKDMRGRLVASVLLSRGSGRPLGVYLRRRLSGVGQTYVKSGLSQLVAAAA
ncbi:hypothetical protein C8Q76DRAFT_693557 [Earliella scabrosa]|nr:hypothetical protein C8Q76DRAFT_693557 [Earliella scabrosa]